MNKVTRYYRELISALTLRLERGEKDIAALTEEARQYLSGRAELTADEVEEVLHALRRDLAEFARSYAQQVKEQDESVFMRVLRQSIWKELLDITDKSQLEWQDIFQDLRHHGVYQIGEIVGLGNLVCEKCQFTRAIYTPEILTRCSACGHDQFQRQPFEP